jgi:hypothetical protein
MFGRFYFLVIVSLESNAEIGEINTEKYGY